MTVQVERQLMQCPSLVLHDFISTVTGSQTGMNGARMLVYIICVVIAARTTKEEKYKNNKKKLKKTNYRYKKQRGQQTVLTNKLEKTQDKTQNENNESTENSSNTQ